MGAFAVVLPSGPEARPPSEVSRMLAASPHRGEEVDVATLGRCTLGVSGEDVSLAVAEGFAAAVVGRIDNLVELVKRFLGDGSRLGASPAEAVIGIFASLRDRTPTVMRGVYAVVVTDGTRLWLFRDHLALAQAMYRIDHAGFVAATEAKQVLVGAGIAREPDIETVEGWFYGDGGDGETPGGVKGVSRPARATILVCDGRRAWKRRYWDPDALFETGRYDEHELRERFDLLMTQAVERTLTGKDLVSLSGGIDSPTIPAYGDERHRELSGRPMAALSFVFPDFPEVDESAYIDVVARRFGMEAHTLQPTARPLDDIVSWVDRCDSPCPIHPPAEAAEYYRVARSLGYTNIIGGELAEFLTSERAGLVSHLVAMGRFGAVPRVIRSQRDINISWLGIARQLVYAFVPRAVLVERERRRRLAPDAGFPAWLDERRVAEANARNLVAPLRRYRWEQTGFFIGPPIGTESDATVQAVCGVMNRRPWVDVDLAEFFVSLPAEVKYPDFRMKTLVRRLLRGRVPDEILDRRDKTYFNQRILGTVDWDGLRRWLVDPPYRMPGVDYAMLAERIEQHRFLIGDQKWAVDLAKTHAFMSLWS
jgi:asparagine synthase (glutamine-hydrolysing)